MQQHREVPNTLDYRTLFPADSFKGYYPVPQSDLLTTGSNKTAGDWTIRHAPNSRVVPFEFGNKVPSFSIPNPRHILKTGGSDVTTIGAKCGIPQPILMSYEFSDEAPSLSIPNPCCLVIASGDNMTAIWAKTNIKYVILVAV